MADGTVVAIIDGRKILHGKVIVASAGTPQQLSATSVPLSSGVEVRYSGANSGLGFVGSKTANGGNVDLSSANGHELAPAEKTFIEIDNLNKVWVDASVGTTNYFTYIAV